MTMASRILVVDDEPMVPALIVRMLSNAGYEVVAVANGQAALDAAVLHIDDISRKRIDTGLPDDVPTVYKPFSSASLREAVECLLGG